MSDTKNIKTIEAFLKTLPPKPGVYRHLNAAGDVLYVGKALNLKKRVTSYFSKTQSSPRIARMVSQVASIDITITETESQALLLEAKLIKELRPKYNIIFRDDKTYPYLMISKDKFPRVAFFRGKKSDERQMFGPYPNAYVVKDSIKLIQKNFRLRTCENSVFQARTKPCLEHQIGRCSAPCVGLIAPADYQNDVRDAVRFLRGDIHGLLAELEVQMNQAADAFEFEKAAIFRDRITLIAEVSRKNSMELDDHTLNVDLVVLVRQMNFVCVNLALVRGGHFLGDRPVIFNTEQHFADSDELGDILETFLLQHYLEKAPEGMIVSNVGLTNSAAIELLAQEHQKKIKFKHKASGVLGTWLDQTQSNALAALTRQFGQNLLQQERLQAFVETLQLAIDKPLEQIRLECFDISHTSGEATTASCVAYFQLAMQPAAYRLYRIKADTQGDDYAAMDEVLRRRLLAAEAGTHPLPDVWLIDGGAGQVSTTMAVMRTFSHLPDLPIVIGVSKGEGRKAGLETLHVVATGESVVLGADSKALALAIEIRDEAHRFAITGMRKARDKQRKQSLLDEIEGIGPVRRKRLLTRFGGLAGLKNASVDELCTVQGVSLEVATRIYEALHG